MSVAGTDPPPRATVQTIHPGSWLQVFGPRDARWTRITLPIPGLPGELAGLRIMHLTDLHLVGRWYPLLDQVLEHLAQSPPDLLLFTGDFVDNKSDPRPALPALRRLMGGVHARLGCFGIPGNHDRFGLQSRVRKSNITLIDGRRVMVPVAGASVELIGLPGILRADLTQEFFDTVPARRAGDSSARIILSHYPDHIRHCAGLQADLFLAGHTHGGQICLPRGYALLRHDSLPRQMCKGVHRIGSTWLVVGRGLGYTGIPVRAFCPSEVIEIQLQPSRGAATLPPEALP